jgi:hypothetical protein
MQSVSAVWININILVTYPRRLGPIRSGRPVRCTLPIPTFGAHVRRGGMLHALAAAIGQRVLFYCAFGERSAMAVQASQDAGLSWACHIQGGVDAWKKACGPLVAPKNYRLQAPFDQNVVPGSPSIYPMVLTLGCRHEGSHKAQGTTYLEPGVHWRLKCRV